MNTMFAHQGGWDEILFVVAPIAVVVGLLYLVKKRVQRTTPPGERSTPEVVRPADD